MKFLINNCKQWEVKYKVFVLCIVFSKVKSIEIWQLVRVVKEKDLN